MIQHVMVGKSESKGREGTDHLLHDAGGEVQAESVCRRFRKAVDSSACLSLVSCES